MRYLEYLHNTGDEIRFLKMNNGKLLGKWDATRLSSHIIGMPRSFKNQELKKSSGIFSSINRAF